MRISLLLVLLIGFLSVGDTYAQSRGNKGPAHAAGCADLRNNATKGLYGLCVAFCASRDQSNVDLNDIASVKAAAPDIATLRKYNALRRFTDPKMPCMQYDDSGNDETDGTSGGGSGGDSGGDTSGGSDGEEPPPPPAQCGCWTGPELASIDGVSPSGDSAAWGADCTSNELNGVMYEDQVIEGYDFGGLITREGVAWASFDAGDGDMEPYNGCYFSTADGVRNFPLEQADAENCVQEIAAHCTTLGNP